MTDEKTKTLGISERIERSHVLLAIAEFEKDGYPEGFKPSHKYDLVHDDKRYPPPAIYALATKQLTGQLPKPKFSVGKGSKCFSDLRDCGFEISEKQK